MTTDQPPTFTAAPVIEYAHTRADLKPPNLKLAAFFLWLSIAAPTVGVGTLLLYRLTAWDDLPGFGFLWLMVGGVTCCVTGLSSLCLFFIVKADAPSGRLARRRYLITLLTSIIAFPIAFACMALGSTWMDGPHFRLHIQNKTGTDLDSVTVHFDGGDVTVGPVKANDEALSGLKWVGHSGPLYLTTRIGTRSVKKLDRIDCNRYHLRGPSYALQIEDHELPKP